MTRPFCLLCLIWAALLSRPALGDDATPFDDVSRDRLLVKVTDCLPPDFFVHTGEQPDAAKRPLVVEPLLETLLAIDEQLDCRRVFRSPPRGWRHPAAAERVGLDRWLVVRFSRERIDLDEIVGTIVNLAGVETCERLIRGRVGDTVPNDPSFSSQWALQAGRLNAPGAWDIATDSSHVVAVIDTGADLDHTDLVDNLWQNPGEIAYNGIDDDLNGFVDDVVGWDFAEDDNSPEDEYGHGIHVSGTVGARGNNNWMVSGVCWNVPIMVVRILDDNGSGYPPEAAAGIVYAADNGASVLNNSWGYTASFQVLEDAVRYSAALDNVIVACAHNQGSSHKIYPAAYDEVMGIIATDQSDQKPSWSNYGSWCDMAAPGQDILSLWLFNGTTYGWGTSMATPHVAGAAALIREVNPFLDADATRWILNQTAVDLGDPGFDDIFGWGRLDLFAAVEKARSLIASSKSLSVNGGTVDFSLDAGSPNGGRDYLLLGTTSGYEPGTLLPGGLTTIPLNRDWFTDFVLARLNSPAFAGFWGRLDASGRSAASLNAPKLNPLWAGTTIHFAYATVNPWDYSSHAAALVIVP